MLLGRKQSFVAWASPTECPVSVTFCVRRRRSATSQIGREEPTEAREFYPIISRPAGDITWGHSERPVGMPHSRYSAYCLVDIGGDIASMLHSSTKHGSQSITELLASQPSVLHTCECYRTSAHIQVYSYKSYTVCAYQ